jgi:hypothetical protein
MKHIVLALSVALVPAVALAGDMYRWEDEKGVVHYSNVERLAPASATVVETPITLEVDRMPGAPGDGALELSGGFVRDGGYEFQPEDLEGYAGPTYRFEALPDAPKIYDEERRSFGCYSAGVLYSGGFAHANDISPILNCYPYHLGPEAWLNSARAELAMRQSGIDPRDMARFFLGQQPR